MTADSSRTRLLALLSDLVAAASAGMDSSLSGDATECIADAVDAVSLPGTDAERAAVYDLVGRFFMQFCKSDALSGVHPRSDGCGAAKGSGTVFSWAGQGQHYAKLPPFAASYAFRAGIVLVRFEVKRAEPGACGRKRLTAVMSGVDAVRYHREARALVVSFERRRPSPAEIAGCGIRKTQEDLNRRAETRILAAVPDSASVAGLSAAVRHRSVLARHLDRFAAPRQADCYIHRDLARDLEADLDAFLRRECLDLDLAARDLVRRQRRARAARAVGKSAIEFIARVDGTQRSLFEKKKFVYRTGYCVTLDRVPTALYAEILENTAQRKVWTELYGTDCQEMDAAFLLAHPFLMVDTGLYSQSFADRLLASFEDLDAAIGGTLVHSESWQALRLIEERYRGRVHCCYIDPPYNTGGITLGYDDRYSTSGWLTLLEGRISLAREFLRDDGLFFASIGDGEEENLKRLVKGVFGEANYLATIVWQRSYAPINLKKFFSDMHEYILVSAKTRNRARIIPLPRNERQKADYKNPDGDPRGPWKVGNLTVGPIVDEQVYRITTPSGRAVLPPRGYCWRYTRERFDELCRENRIWFGVDGNHAPTPKCFLAEVKDGVTPVTLWTYRDAGHYQTSMRELRDLLGDALFVNPKPLALMDRIFRISIGSQDTVLDSFAGSGSTAHAIINLNRSDRGDRRYIVIEAADTFAAMIRTRIQKACYASAWKDGRPRTTDGVSHAFKYIVVEQYEDTIENLDIRRKEPDPTGLHVPIRYVVGGDGPGLQVQLGAEVFDRPFVCTLTSAGGGVLHEEPVDLVETFNYLLGLQVTRMQTYLANGTLYRVVHGISRSGERTTAIWRTIPGLDLDADRQFIEKTILADPGWATGCVYINGRSQVKGALAIEPEFQRLMFG